MKVNCRLWSNQMMAMMIAGTWRKFLCLHWKAPLGEEPGPRSNISPAHTLAEVKDKRKLRILWFGQEENTSYFSSITLSSTQTRTLRQAIKTILLVIHYNIFPVFCMFVCPACPILCDNLYDQMSKVHQVGSNYLPHLPNYHQQILHDAPNIKSPRGSLKHLFMGWNFSFGRCHGNITFTVVAHCCAAWCRNSKLYITLQT